MSRSHYIMDFETISNCFIACFEDYKTEDKRVFVVHELQNDFEEFVKFLEQNQSEHEWHISFNGLAFDSQITQHILLNKKKLIGYDAETIARFIYEKAQNIINNQDKSTFNEFSEKELFIKQIDLFKLNHWDNPSKRSSLKWIQYSMDWHNIMDMPIPHYTEITTQEQLNTIIEYCINDVKSTKEIFNRSKSHIALRKTLTEEYGINLYSASEPKISKELFLKFLSEDLDVRKSELRSLRTKRKEILVKDILLDYIDFKKIEFKQLLKNFREKIIDPANIKGAFKYSVRYKGVTTNFGLGGLHGAADPGVYKSSKEMLILSSDVVSFYPNLAIKNKWSPAHLPKAEFCRLYEWLFEERKKIPKKDPKNYVFKIVLNSTYGLSIDENSFLYDPQFGMQITINGQLSLTMLYEMICEGIPGAIPLMQNTDGVETMIPVEYKEKYFEICKEWERITSLQLEHDEYQKVIIGDVNSYIGVYKFKETTEEEYNKLILDKNTGHWMFKEEDGKYYYAPTKCKGRFEFTDMALHKNKSHLIVPKALYNYFVKDIVPEDYIVLNKDILDYCAGVKITKDWKAVSKSIRDFKIHQEELQHTLRYYISKKGSKIVKINELDGREIQLEAGKWMQTPFIKIEKKKWKDYDVDESYYLRAIRDEIRHIEGKKQLNLFYETTGI